MARGICAKVSPGQVKSEDMKEASFISKIFILPIRLYQITLSPLLGKNCRFQPTCSQYMIEAIREWGPLKGLYLGLRRIGKCHPWGPHGHDPVPKKHPQQAGQKT